MKKNNEKKAKCGLVTVDELVRMKTLQLTGLSKSAIAREVRRNIKTVSNSLASFEMLLPDFPELKSEIIEQVEKTKNQLFENAQRIAFIADAQVMRKIGTADAVDAARIAKIYFDRAGSLGGFDTGPETDEDGNKIPAKVLKIINKTFNINVQINDNRKADGPDRRVNEKSIGRRKKNIVEGVMSA